METEPVRWIDKVRELYEQKDEWTDIPCKNPPLGIARWPSTQTQQERYIDALCTKCPRQSECLFLALVIEERYWVWGGTSEWARVPLINLAKDKVGASFGRHWTKRTEMILRRLANLMTSKNTAKEQN